MSLPNEVEIDRIVLTLEGVPLAQAELLAAQLQAALAAQPWVPRPQDGPDLPGADPANAAATAQAQAEAGGLTGDLSTRLAGPALVQAVAARLAALVGLAAQVRELPEEPPWP